MNTINTQPAAKASLWRRSRLLESGYPAVEDDLGNSVWILDPDQTRRLTHPGTASISQLRARYTMRRLAVLRAGDVRSQCGLAFAYLIIASIVFMPWVAVAPWTLISILTAAWAATIARNYALQRRSLLRLSPFASEIASAGLVQGACPCCLEHVPAECSDHTGHSAAIAACPRCSASWKQSRVRQPAAYMREVAHRSNASGLFTSNWQSIDPANALLTDAEGVIVPRVTQYRHASSATNGPHADQLAALKAASSPRHMHIPFVTMTMTLVAPLIIHFSTGSVTSGVLNLVTGSPLSLTALLGVVVGSVLLDAQRITRSIHRKHNLVAQELPARLLAADLCPTCAGNLRNTAPNTQGRISCPNCAAVWQVTSSDANTPQHQH